MLWYTTVFAVLLFCSDAILYTQLQTSLTTSLDTELQHQTQQVASGKYSSAEAYFWALIEADQRQQAREYLDALLEEGLASPSGEMTAQDWENIRQRVREHYTTQQRR